MKRTGSGWRQASGFLLLAALAGCQPERPKEQPVQPPAAPPTPAPATAAEVPAQRPPYSAGRQATLEAEAETLAADTLVFPSQPLRFSRLKTGPVFHRYTGTMGQERVTAELSWRRPDTITGRFYRWRGGPEYQLRYHGRRQGPFRLSVRYVDDGRQREQDLGTWRLLGAPGLTLHGVWLDSAGRRRPFALREDYRQGVRYDVQTLTLRGGQPTSSNSFTPSLTRDYLHLRGPLRPVWYRLQAPALATRKHRLLAVYERDGDTSYYLSVRLNDFNLLSYQNFYVFFASGGGRHDGFEDGLLDLVTGRPLTLASQLQPGYEPTLRHLLTNRLRHDFDQPSLSPHQANAPERLVELPTSDDLSFNGLALTGAGLEGSYLPDELYAVLGPEAKVYSIPYPVLIPYRELRPLVRPGTPLARMLAARGLW